MSYLMGIDLGTSSLKTLIMDLSGNVLAIAQEEYGFSIPREGYAEQDPNIWWSAAVNTIKKSIFLANINAKDIKAIGLSGQMHGACLLNKNYELLHPAVIWCDQRAIREVEYINRTIGKERLGELTCNTMAVGFQTATMLWFKNNKPEIYEKTAYVVTPKDYLRYLLTGELAMEVTDASGTLAFDTANAKWSAELLNILSLNSDMYPKVYNTNEVAANISSNASSQTGLFTTTCVCYGGSDQVMQAIGNGVVKKGQVSATIGTGGQVFAPIFSPAYDKQLRMHTFCNFNKNTWFVLGGHLSAGLSLRWLREKLFSKEISYNEMDIIAKNIKPGSDGLIYLPYLGGERTPHMDPNARAMFFGLTHGHGREHMVRAVMEGVTYSLKDSMDILKDMNVPIDTIIASGGGAKSDIWLSMKADIFNREVYTSNMLEQACVGAAICGGVGVGVYPSVADACEQIIKWNDTPVLPDPTRAKQYAELHQIFKELYVNNKQSMEKLWSVGQ